MVRKSLWLACIVVTATAVGCGQNTGDKSAQTKGGGKTEPASTTSVDGKKLLAADEPKGAKGVLEVRQEAKNGDDVVMVGRIAGSRKPFVEGRAAFSVTDIKIEPCHPDEGCPTPWDCCCTSRDELLPAMAQIKFEGSDGKTLGVGAKELLGVKELSVVVVTGKAVRDDKGNLTVVAKDLHIRKGKE